MVETVHEYYTQQSILPTHGEFMSKDAMDKYERMRREIFTQRLHLPAQLFRDSDLIEFGPDSGDTC